MFIPLYTDRPLERLPAMNLAIMGVTILLFLIQQAVPAVEGTLLLYPGDPGLTGIFGHAFLHGGWMHLIGNMLFLYIFGNAVNDILGHAAYLGFYLAGAAAAAMAHLLLSDAPALGASGAVAACSGAYLALYPRSRVHLLIIFFLITRIAVPAVWFVGLFFLVDLILGLDAAILGGGDNVARWAHVGGGVFGAVASLGLMRFALVRRHNADGLAVLQRRKLRRDLDPKRMGQSHGSAMDIVPESKQQDPRLGRVQELRAKINDARDRGNLARAADLYVQLLAVDDRQTLDADGQLEVAGGLVTAGRHAEAAKAYELFLTRPGTADDVEVEKTRLMLGLIYARYLGNPGRALTHLSAAERGLRQQGQTADADFAAREAAALSPAAAGPGRLAP